MSLEAAVSDHYAHGDLVNAITAALPALGKTIETLTADDLAPLDEFHIGGRVATDHLLDQLDPSADAHLLDVGSGLGGAARHVAGHYGCRVTGIDLTPEYVAAGRVLCDWLQLAGRVTLEQGSALAMPFADQSFDGGYMLHVGMNIADKAALFGEIARVMKPGVIFGVYDVMRLAEGELAYPVPWAAQAATSHLAMLEDYRQALAGAGFTVGEAVDRREFALAFFEQIRARTEAAGGPPPLGIHTLMGETARTKVHNMLENISRGLIAPVEVIAIKQ